MRVQEELPSGQKYSRLSRVLEYSAMIASLLGGVCLTIPHWAMFAFWIVARLCWIAFGYMQRHWGLVLTQCFFFVINVISLWRLTNGVWHT